MEDSQRSESTICVGVLAGVRSSAGNLLPGSWTQLLDEIRLLSIPPFLIVTSRVADDYLWAEALNLGAYDVLAKPLDRTEVTRIPQFGLAALAAAVLCPNDVTKSDANGSGGIRRLSTEGVAA